MRIHVLSDLHLEQAPYLVAPAVADLIVLAGDVAPGTGGVAWARSWADGLPVLYVAGNHEFYGHDFPGTVEAMREAADGSSVHVLEDDEAVIDGVRFLGCSLWTDFEFDGVARRPMSMTLCERLVNDYGEIAFGAGARVLTAADTLAAHRRSRRWLAARLAEPWEGSTVVISHHAPVIRTRPEQPLLRAIAGAFASDLSDLMGGDRVATWIFGHTHRVADLDVRGTRVISNPRGYPHQPVAGFDPELVVEVPVVQGVA